MWPFDALIDAANWVIYLIQNLFYFAVFPLVVIVNILWSDLNYIYAPFAMIINMMVGFTSYGIYFLYMLIPTNFPPVWTVLLIISIQINIAIRLYNAIRHLKTWVPTWGG